MRSSLAYLSFVYLLLGLGAAVPAEEAAPKKHPVNSQLFQNFVHYAKLTSASGTASCPNPPGGVVNVKYINKNTQTSSTQARVYRDDKAKEIILSFAGSVPGTLDDETDSDDTLVTYNSPGVKNCQGCQTHQGFLNAWNSVADGAHDIVSKQVKAHKGYKVVVTGYSLGAGLACLAYSSFNGQGLPVKAAYTYGQPRVGNPAFAKHIDNLSGADNKNIGNFHRVTHASDVVTQEPGQDLGYRHPLTEFWISAEKGQSAKNTFRCYGEESPACVDGHQVPSNPTKGSNDHLHYCNLDFTDPSAQCS